MEETTPRKSPAIDHLVTVDEVEQRSDLNVFWQLPDPEEDAVEATRDLAWVQGWVD